MKRLLYILLCGALSATILSCSSDDTMAGDMSYDNDNITMSFATSLLATRAVDHTPTEAAVHCLDIIFFNADDKTHAYNERVQVSASQGTVALKVKRSIFGVGKEYKIYVVANSTAALSDFAAASIPTVNDLLAMRQSDERIHITGSSVTDAPLYFLMDGQATLSGSDEKNVVVYDGDNTQKTVLSVLLRRAAAKVVVKLSRTDKVEFIQNIHMGYYLRNLPYNTWVIDSHEDVAELRTPDKTMGDYYNWSPNEVVVTAYVYSHSWESQSFFERGTSLIINIPMIFNGNEYENSYYQIALSKNSKFERNHYYEVKATINAPGAQEESNPLELENLKYYVEEWTQVDIDVNGENAPTFLSVSHDTVKMYNMEKDNTTLQFSSSSPVDITVKDIHFIDKFGKKTQVTTSEIVNNISGTTEGGNSGIITINSPLPANNTIRYFTLEVTNQTGLTEEVVVEHYPLTYITNQQGWYSYRSDFGSHFQLRGNRYVRLALNMREAGYGYYRYEYWNGDYTYNIGAGASGYFWHSKVAVPNSNGDGKSTTYFYTWNGTNSSATTPKYESTCESNTNARMYHVRITSTSNDYAIGRPRLDANGYTDSGSDNAKLVSPSFMIASRLGAVYTTYGNLNKIDETEDYNSNGIPDRRDIFNEHCQNYVEVYKDENGNAVVLDNWRLPTEAELKIIESLQGYADEDADAIDYLLNGIYYMSASGPVRNYKANQEGELSAVRCVRDAY